MEMTQEWIQKFNNKCAEFLGYVNTTPTDKDFNIYQNDKGMIIGNKIYTMLETMSMKFHSDWNWIHEMIDKILITPDLFGRKDTRFVFRLNSDAMVSGRFWCNIELSVRFGKIHPEYRQERISYASSSSKKDATIQAIDQFIDWYNEQKKS